MPYKAKSPYHQYFDDNPGSLGLAQDRMLPFLAYEQFKFSDLKELQQLITQVADHFWRPSHILESI